VRGCLSWQRDGLGEPDKVIDATKVYRVEMDTLAAFIDECCIVGPNVWCKFKDLYSAYDEWCKESNESAEPKRRFADQLTERGFEKVNGTDNVAIRRGIALRHDGGPQGPGTPSRINDPSAKSSHATRETPPVNGEDVNLSNDPTEFINYQNPCKYQETDERISEDYRESKTFLGNLPCERELRKNVNPRYFINSEARHEVTELLANPPAWLVNQHALRRINPALMRPTCSAISLALYGTSERRDEVRPFVEEYLKDGHAA
jgi:hypothetical protein